MKSIKVVLWKPTRNRVDLLDTEIGYNRHFSLSAAIVFESEESLLICFGKTTL
jgi:hypothetical protein